MLSRDTYSPLRDKYPEGGIIMSVEELLHYSLWLSDNNACDILFARFGGTVHCASYIKSLGLRHTQILWTEDEMHNDITRCNGNYTTPSDATRLLEMVVSDKQHEWLRECMMQCRTGQDRLPALLPTDSLRIGHKTGTGGVLSNGKLSGINDIGFVFLPDGRHYCIAVFCNDSMETMPATASLIAEISKETFRYIQNMPVAGYGR